MIFITLGSQKFQFNRLLKAVDDLCESRIIEEKIFAQTGYSDYIPKNYDYKHFLDREEFCSVTQQADIVITHGGTGAIISAVKKNKKVIAVPRLVEYGEHVDDHQLQLVKQFDEMNLIYQCKDCKQLAQAIIIVRHTQYNSYRSNTETIIKSIEEFIERNKR